MEDIVDSVMDFVRIRHVNFAVLGILSAACVLFQFIKRVFQSPPVENCAECLYAEECLLQPRSLTVPKSRSRSRKRNVKRLYRRCVDCGYRLEA